MGLKSSGGRSTSKDVKNIAISMSTSGRAQPSIYKNYHEGDEPCRDDDGHKRGHGVTFTGSPEPWPRRARGSVEEKQSRNTHGSACQTDTAPAQVAQRRLLKSAVREAVEPVRVSMKNGTGSRRAEASFLESTVREAVGSAVEGNDPNWKEPRLVDSAFRDLVDSGAVSIRSGNSFRRTNSLLLDSAVKDVSPAALVRNPGVKRLRSVVVADSENHDQVPESNEWHESTKTRLSIAQHGLKVPPAMAVALKVALKAAAAAAEDVNNFAKSRRTRSVSVWDRLGKQSKERLGEKENEMKEMHMMDSSRRDAKDSEDNIGSAGGEEARIGKRLKLRKGLERVGNGARAVETEVEMDSDLGLGDSADHSGKMLAEDEWYQSVRNSQDSNEINNRGGTGREPGNLKNCKVVRFHHDTQEHDLLMSPHSTGLQYSPDEFERTVIPGSSGVATSLNKLSHSQVNVDEITQQTGDADTDRNTALNTAPQGTNSDGMDTDDVSEMKKRMRQVQLEMTKLRAKQAEVSKVVQKVGNAPRTSVRKRSQAEVDLHSVCVTNIHFAATREIVAAHFSSCGDILCVTILTDITTGKPKGTAYLEFSSKDGVEKALNLSDSCLLSRVLKVRRKATVTDSVPSPALGHQRQRLPFVLKRAPTARKFSRGGPLLGMRISTANLQWKREISSPIVANESSKFGSTIPSSNRIAAVRGPHGSLMRDRNKSLGPIRGTRSMSYIRPTPYPLTTTSGQE